MPYDYNVVCSTLLQNALFSEHSGPDIILCAHTHTHTLASEPSFDGPGKLASWAAEQYWLACCTHQKQVWPFCRRCGFGGRYPKCHCLCSFQQVIGKGYIEMNRV